MKLKDAPWKKSYDKPRQHSKRQRHFFAHKGICLWVKAIGFSIVMYGTKSRSIRKLKCRRNEAFELWCWRRLLRVPCKPVNPRGNQSWLFVGRTDGATPILWPPDVTHWKRFWCWERLKAGGEGVDRGWDGWMASLTQWTWVWASKLVMVREAWHAAVHGVTKSQTRLSGWTEQCFKEQKILILIMSSLPPLHHPWIVLYMLSRKLIVKYKVT